MSNVKNKKIIFFSRDLNIGGMEKALVILLNALVSLGYDVTLTLERKEGILLKNLDGKIKVQEYRLSQSKIAVFRKTVNFIHRICWGIRNYRRYGFSCNYATYSVIGSKLALIASSNSALYVHSDYYEYFSGNVKSIRDFFLQQEIAKIKNVIFVSQESKLKIEKIFSEYLPKFYVISNLIDYKSIIDKSTTDVSLDIPLNKQLIVFVGRLEENSKKLSRLLESIKIVTQNSDEFYLLIIGEGNDKRICEELIHEYHLSNCVKMIGETPNPYPYMKKADCVILTSDYEGFPVVYNECLVLKIPVLTTVPVSDEYLDFRNYSIVVEKDSKQIANALLNQSYKGISFDNVEIPKINEKRLNQIKNMIDQ